MEFAQKSWRSQFDSSPFSILIIPWERKLKPKFSLSGVLAEFLLLAAHKTGGLHLFCFSELTINTRRLFRDNTQLYHIYMPLQEQYSVVCVMFLLEKEGFLLTLAFHHTSRT